MDCTIRVAKSKALISFAVTSTRDSIVTLYYKITASTLICAFVYAWMQNVVFFHDAAYWIIGCYDITGTRTSKALSTFSYSVQNVFQYFSIYIAM